MKGLAVVVNLLSQSTLLERGQKSIGCSRLDFTTERPKNELAVVDCNFTREIPKKRFAVVD